MDAENHLQNISMIPIGVEPVSARWPVGPGVCAALIPG